VSGQHDDVILLHVRAVCGITADWLAASQTGRFELLHKAMMIIIRVDYSTTSTQVNDDECMRLLPSVGEFETAKTWNGNDRMKRGRDMLSERQKHSSEDLGAMKMIKSSKSDFIARNTNHRQA
jgi:hypothetical protein